MAWLTGYLYRKKVPINSTAAGTQTNYQMKLIVGESSTASGIDVHCENRCQNFPNDIRFTDTNGTTKHDYWIETGSSNGTTPNQKVTIWIEIASIPHPGSVDLYMYYGKSSDYGESNGNNTCVFFDDFLNVGEGGWDKDIGAAAEHPIIKDDTLYFVSGNGLWILGLDGTEQHHYLSGKTLYCAPVVLGDYVYSWEYSDIAGETCRLHKTKINDGTDSEVAGTRVDFEVLTTANVDGIDLIFIPKGGNVTAIRADNLSTYWTSSVEVTSALHHWDGGLILDNYLYTRQIKTGDHKLCKLTLSSGTITDSVALEDENHYAPLLYDADHSQIIVTEKTTMKAKAFDKDDFAENWSYTFEETTGFFIMHGCSYHNNRIYIADMANDEDSGYIYCINATSGAKVWKSSVPVNYDVGPKNHLIGDDYLFVASNDHVDRTYHKSFVLDITDGALYDTIEQTSDSCCCCPVISDGIMYFGMWSGDKKINARKLGPGNKTDCPFKCDAAHTGYIGTRLTSYSPEPSYTLTDKWTNNGNYELFNNMLKKYAANTSSNYWITSKTQLPSPLIIETRAKVGSDWSNEHGWSFVIGWDSAWATTGYYGGHYKDVSIDSSYLRRFSGGAPPTDSDNTTDSIVADTWYNLSLLIGSSNQYYKVDEVQKGSLSTSPPTNSTNIMLSTGRASSSSSYTTYFDWVFVRKYASPEPAWGSWGDEKTADDKYNIFNPNIYYIELSKSLALTVLKTPYKLYFVTQDIAAGKIMFLI